MVIMSESERNKLQEIRPNSNASKERIIEPVVSKSVKKRKKSVSEKFTSIFVSEDVGDVKSYLIFDILVPALKDTVSDMIKGGIDAILYGNERPRNVSRTSSGGARVSYQGYYDKTSSRSTSSRTITRSGKYDRKASHDFRDVVFEDKRDAVAVLDGLVDSTVRYEFATVMDFNQLAGQESNFTDNDFGWDDLSSARVIRIRDGYILDLPIPVPID